MLNVYVTNLEKYNEGELCGKWVSLPVSEEKLNEVFDEIQICHKDKDGNEVQYFNEIGCPYEEYFISDYESNIAGLEIKEYSSFEKLNELAENIDALDDKEQEILSSLIDDCGYSTDEAFDIIDCERYRVYVDCYNMTDIAYEVVEERGYLDEIPEYLRNYFDYEAFGRDLEINGNYTYIGNGEYIEVEVY